jgi:serine protease inhibitor
LWGQRGLTWKQGFLDALARDFGTGMRVVDFERATEEARAAINEWTSERTHAKIPQILAPGAVNSATRLVLVNAIYLKAPWQYPFAKDMTRDGAFHLADGSVVEVPMMTGADKPAQYVEVAGVRAVRLPYFGGTLAMTIVLDDAGPETVQALAAAGPTESASVTMPSFTFRLPAQLKPVLSQLGLGVAFSDEADFSGMTDDAALTIDEVVHEAFISVDEAGTEAAAATAVVMRDLSLVVPMHDVTVDRPFTFVIHDTTFGTPLFVGRVEDPRR